MPGNWIRKGRQRRGKLAWWGTRSLPHRQSRHRLPRGSGPARDQHEEGTEHMTRKIAAALRHLSRMAPELSGTYGRGRLRIITDRFPTRVAKHGNLVTKKDKVWVRRNMLMLSTARLAFALGYPPFVRDEMVMAKAKRAGLMARVHTMDAVCSASNLAYRRAYASRFTGLRSDGRFAVDPVAFAGVAKDLLTRGCGSNTLCIARTVLAQASDLAH